MNATRRIFVALKRSRFSTLAILVFASSLSMAQPALPPGMLAEDTDSSEPVRNGPDAPTDHPSSVASDSVETSIEISPWTVDVLALDVKSVPAIGVSIELLSMSDGRIANRWQKHTDASGHARFAEVTPSTSLQYRVTTTSEGSSYGTRPFSLEDHAGAKVLFHVYPITRDPKKSIILGNALIFIEPRDDVLVVEYVQQYQNIGRTVLMANDLKIPLPARWRGFSTSLIDADLSLAEKDNCVMLQGSIAPGQHATVFSFQIPTAATKTVAFDLGLWPGVHQAQVATLARSGLSLDVEGFPAPNQVQGKGGQPLLVSARSFANEDLPPGALRIELDGLPVPGMGRVVAAALAVLIAMGSLWRARCRPVASSDNEKYRRAKDRIIDELAALERAHQKGLIGKQTYADTRESLLIAFVRLERLSATN
jgi:hypothetical protein